MVTLLKVRRPFVVGVVVERAAASTRRIVQSAFENGADVVELNLASLPEPPSRKDFRSWRKPVYTSCRRSSFMGIYGPKFAALPQRDDARRMAEQLAAVENGAAGCDIEADTFSQNSDEWSDDRRAIDQQRKVVNQAHSLGAAVIYSWHPPRKLKVAEAVRRAQNLQDRGADFVKIVERVATVEEALDSLAISLALEKSLKVPFVFLALGAPAIRFRPLVTRFGAAYLLARPSVGSNRLRAQPTISVARQFLSLP